jgi:hypothetical protein
MPNMALKFVEQHAVYNPSSDRLRFFATDLGLSLTFVLSRKVLDYLEGSNRVPESKLLAAFERHKGQIRVAAARAYRATGATREAIAINPEHMAR